MLTCTICGCEIGYEEDFRQHETNKEEICMKPECLHKHMVANITLANLQEYAEGEPELLKAIVMGGMNAIPAEEMKWLTEWYEQFYHECFNDEPDAATLQEWKADRDYQNTEYYRMVMPK